MNYYLSLKRKLPKAFITNYSIICLPGQKGEKGDRGKAGPIGPIGKAGLKGDIGPVGLPGLAGIKGDRGNTGSKGQKGQKGNSGRSIFSPIMVSPPKSVQVSEGRNVTFFCEADGNPIPKIKWQFEAGKEDKMRYKFSGENGVTIYDVRDKDAGQIMCVASNILGSQKRNASLDVLGKILFNLICSETPERQMNKVLNLISKQL